MFRAALQFGAFPIRVRLSRRADRRPKQSGGAVGTMRRRSVLTLMVILLAMALSACEAPFLVAGDQLRARQTVNGVTITLETQREPLVNQPQWFRVTLTDRQGRPIDGADVYLDLDMNMLCLSGSQPLATQVGPGQYEARSVYQMAGEWNITVYAQIDGKEHSALFHVTVHDPAGGPPWIGGQAR